MEEYEALIMRLHHMGVGNPEEMAREAFIGNPIALKQVEVLDKPKKRKVSAYSREFGRQYRALRKKHPRMSHGEITKKAHAATRKIRKPRK